MNLLPGQPVGSVGKRSTHGRTYIWLLVTRVAGNTYFHLGGYHGSNSLKTGELMERVSLGASIAVSDSVESIQLVGDIDNWFQYLAWVGFYIQSSN